MPQGVPEEARAVVDEDTALLQEVVVVTIAHQETIIEVDPLAMEEETQRMKIKIIKFMLQDFKEEQPKENSKEHLRNMVKSRKLIWKMGEGLDLL